MYVGVQFMPVFSRIAKIYGCAGLAAAENKLWLELTDSTIIRTFRGHCTSAVA